MTPRGRFSSYGSTACGAADPDGAGSTAPASTDAAPVHATAALATVALAQFVVALDYSVIYVALPSVARDLHLDPAVAQWVISAYAVFFAGFLMVGGRLTDRVGARRLFIIATTVFGVTSAIGGAAQDATVLLIARGGQGLGAALLQPAVLGLIGTTFPAGRSRSRALAVWGSVGASGLAIGALLGGLLTTASWRLTFLVNIPLVLLCVFGATTSLGSARDRNHLTPIPLLASALGTAAALALVVGFTFSANQGWDSASTLTSLGLAVLLAVGFIVNEHTSHRVLVEPVLRRIHSLWIGIAATALYMASVGSEFYLVTLLLQSAKGYTPSQAGVAFLPLAVMVTFGSMASGRVVRRLTAPTVLIGGFAIATSGLAWLALALHGGSYVTDLLPGLVISGFGHGVIYTSMFIIGTHDVPSEHHGAAGALLTTSQYLSAAITVAILTLVLGTSPTNGSYRTAFLMTTAAAAGGIGVIASQRRRLT
jgi:predicted MFS family arabinose efflux permease